MSFDTALARLEPLAYALFRLMAGGMFLLHGVQKLLGWPEVIPNIAVLSQTWIGGVIELGAGLLIALGLFTRPAAFLASGTMAVAYLQFHWKPWAGGDWLPGRNHGELALLYCFAFLFIAARGAGAASLDRLRA
jgi:putative oxidoreductase